MENHGDLRQKTIPDWEIHSHMRRKICEAMVLVYLPTSNWVILGKCWDSYTSTMVRIWDRNESKQISNPQQIYVI